MPRISLPLCLFFIFILNTFRSSGQENQAPYRAAEASHYSAELVDEFYQLNHGKLFWYGPSINSISLRKSLIRWLDRLIELGLNRANYHYPELMHAQDSIFSTIDSLSLKEADRLFTDAALTFCRDLYMGRDIPSLINSDEISFSGFQRDRQLLLHALLNCTSDSLFNDFVSSLEPGNGDYNQLKKALAEKISAGDSIHVKSIAYSLNIFRWMLHFHLPEYVVVNIPSATLGYYKMDSLLFHMKTVVGKPSTKTPRLATYIDKIIYYPYWNVPRKIVISEYLPIFSKNPSMVDSMNMQIVNAKGNVVDYHKLNWALYNKQNFPFELRQSTGCDNALGVIKFNLTSPYDVYMHDTNFKRAFSFERRFYSHGCIRLEKPILLANQILDGKVDSNYLKSCLRDQKPVPVFPDKRIPVFVIYMCATPDDQGNINYFRDVYELMKK
ncbi:MAG: L,D-transpeptidase family protein [Chitinophagales bacterium]